MKETVALSCNCTVPSEGKSFKRTVRGFSLLVATAILFCVFASCSQLFEPEESSSSYGSITLQLPDNKRSLASEQCCYYEVIFSCSGISTVFIRGNPGELLSSSELPEGYYDVEIYAYGYDGKKIGYGKKSDVRVRAGEVSYITLGISEIKDNGNDSSNISYEGTVSYSVPGEFSSVQAAIDACPTGTLTCTINVTGTMDGVITLADSSIKNVIIKGSGAESTVLKRTDAIASGSIGTINVTASGISLTLEDLTVEQRGISIESNSQIYMNQVVVKNCGTGNNIGGLYVGNGATLTMTDCRFAGNLALDGGALKSLNSTVKMTDCTFENNTAINQGGGLDVCGGSISMKNCVLKNNHADANSGHTIFLNGGGTVFMTGCSITHQAGDTTSRIFVDGVNGENGTLIKDGSVLTGATPMDN